MNVLYEFENIPEAEYYVVRASDPFLRAAGSTKAIAANKLRGLVLKALAERENVPPTIMFIDISEAPPPKKKKRRGRPRKAAAE